MNVILLTGPQLFGHSAGRERACGLMYPNMKYSSWKEGSALVLMMVNNDDGILDLDLEARFYLRYNYSATPGLTVLGQSTNQSSPSSTFLKTQNM